MIEYLANIHFFEWVVQKNHLDIAYHLLLVPTLFDSIERECKYSEYVHHFARNQLEELRVRKINLKNENTNATFDLQDSEEAKLCFYMIRDFIRQGDKTSFDDIEFLLSIPAVKTLAHTEVTPNCPNELLQLALKLERKNVVNLLLKIPAIYQLDKERPKNPILTKNVSSHALTLRILGGFIAAAGALAIALAFAVLSAATLGMAGIVTASIGGALLLTGCGFFSTGAIQARQQKQHAQFLIENKPCFSN